MVDTHDRPRISAQQQAVTLHYAIDNTSTDHNEQNDVRNPRLFIVLLITQSCMKQLVLHTDVLAASIAASHC